MDYEIYNTDCIKKMYELKEENFQADLSIFSPPFSSLYAYTNDLHDMGNSKESDTSFTSFVSRYTSIASSPVNFAQKVCPMESFSSNRIRS